MYLLNFLLLKYSSFLNLKDKNVIRGKFYASKFKISSTIGSDFSVGDYSEIFLESANASLQIGKNVYLRRFCNIHLFNTGKLLIGDNVFFNNYCSVNCFGEISIGAGTLLGEGVKLYDHNHLHHVNDGLFAIERNNFSIGKIIIGVNCWIGSNVTILNNVEIGDNVIIGAGCLIYKSIPSNSIVKQEVKNVITSR